MAEQNNIFRLNFNPALQDNKEDFKKALLGQVTPSVMAQVPGIENITLGQAPIVSQEGIQYQTYQQSPILPSGETAVYAMTPEQLAARQAARGQIDDTGLINTAVQLIGNAVLGENRGISGGSLSTSLPPTFTPPSEGATPKEGAKDIEPVSLVSLGLESPQQLEMKRRAAGIPDQLSAQPTTTPALESVVTTTPQPEATFTLPSGEVQTIMSGQGVASAFGRESGRPMTFQVDGGSVTVPSAQAIQTMNLGEQAAARQAQQEFLASPAAREMSNRMLQSVANDPFAQASAEREARIGGGGATATERDTRRAESRVTSSQNIPTDVREAMNTPAGGLTRDQINRLGDWQGSTQGQAYMAEQKAADSRGQLTFDQKLAQNKFDFDVAKFSYEKEKEASDGATALRKSEESAKYAARDILRQNENVMRKAQRAGQSIGFTTTGATGALFGMIPGTGAYDQKATIETLQADAAFSTLQRMRDASKTGGALGNVSERELDLLMGAVGNLKIGQSEEQFRNNLAEYVNLRNAALLNIYDAFAADYSQGSANEAFKISSREDLVPSETGSSQSMGTPVETQSGRYEVTAI